MQKQLNNALGQICTRPERTSQKQTIVQAKEKSWASSSTVVELYSAWMYQPTQNLQRGNLASKQTSSGRLAPGLDVQAKIECLQAGIKISDDMNKIVNSLACSKRVKTNPSDVRSTIEGNFIQSFLGPIQSNVNGSQTPRVKGQGEIEHKVQMEFRRGHFINDHNLGMHGTHPNGTDIFRIQLACGQGSARCLCALFFCLSVPFSSVNLPPAPTEPVSA
jgi:hypothetical protein